jgi:hypothetical protein
LLNSHQGGCQGAAGRQLPGRRWAAAARARRAGPGHITIYRTHTTSSEILEVPQLLGWWSNSEVSDGHSIRDVCRLTALLLAGLIGCGSKPIDGPVSKVSELVAVCAGRHAPTAAPFAGARPHPILVVPPKGALKQLGPA